MGMTFWQTLTAIESLGLMESALVSLDWIVWRGKMVVHNGVSLRLTICRPDLRVFRLACSVPGYFCR